MGTFKEVVGDLPDANHFHFTSRETAQLVVSSASLSQWWRWDKPQVLWTTAVPQLYQFNLWTYSTGDGHDCILKDSLCGT